MLSPVSGRNGANLVSMMNNRVQGPLAEAKIPAVGAVNGQGAEALSQAVSQLEQMIDQLMGMLRRSGAVPAGADMGGGAAPVGAAGGGQGGGMHTQDSFDAGAAGAAAPAGLPSLDGTGSGLLDGIEIADPQLRRALEMIATHPDGAKLIAAAKANGLTSIAANPALNPDGGAGTEGLHIPGQGRIEIANPNSPDLIHVLAHELGHAATKADGNSQLEEQTVDALGDRIHNDLMGRDSSFNLDLASYSDLAMDNGVLNSLRMLGIRV